MTLPKKDKHWNYYISYSQITTFKRSKKDYYEQYILNKPFEWNAYTDFGNKVGKWLEDWDLSLFSSQEQETLEKVTRLDEFERFVKIQYEWFYLLWFIDTCSKDLKRIIDYKTGWVGKHKQYASDEYTQLHTYALWIRQELWYNVEDASVEFITRKGNAYRWQQLYVWQEDIIKIPIDLSEEKLKSVYWWILNTTKEISKFYNENL